MRSFNAVLFDLDGTLVDSAPDFYHLVTNMRKERNVSSTLDYETLRRSVSNGGKAVIQTAFQIEPEHPDFDDLLVQLLTEYEKQPALHSRLFDGFNELLEWLDQEKILWGVVTNKPSRFTHKILQQLHLNQRCSSIICPEDVSASKPSPEGLLLACQQMNIAPQKTLYVGDHIRDIQAGHAAGMTTVAAGFGYLAINESIDDWSSHFKVDHATELLSLLQSM
ncbi:phosphoglycolate phosphatase [Nitrincola tibetensis]|uniref:Phosphoglycolate phosphatase n=1 Tax=Nitrincola tibetensis TaxID=2219697 RepID=A0A364NL61_9GAMM|nr:HAD-IA family hydrolase [Nitrincola tibetensis]RAU17849.1 phosphoglycolate phosphatase [Nitrincola tibetensis]